ncbi:caspase-8 [Diorhabda sublineata]|uniref:caspase-8 n=1 Tax=Diorhabda sublineata TaxID=1163346 RepID=UPI0024E0EAA3|nr:caspase-8 [Diorhabda sublineata]XP_056632421.1 caspase-8 [Diorhabda sublineata]
MGNTNNKYDTDNSNYVESDSESVDDLSDTLPCETTDAATNPIVSLPDARSLLNVEKVKHIEQELDIDELISVVYLLLEDRTEIEVQLQRILLLLAGGSKNILSLWAEYHSHKRDYWERKLVEAFCTIKNYAVLRKLGYEKSDVIAHFLPNQPHSLYINKLKKTIYLICDNLDRKDTKTFLNYVRESFNRCNIYFDEYGEEYLEVYFLKWESINQLNYNEIKQTLKVMGMEHLKDKLETALSGFPEEIRQNSNRSVNKINDQPLQSGHRSLEPISHNRQISVTCMDNQRVERATKRNLENMSLQQIVENEQHENYFMEYQHNLTPTIKSVTNSVETLEDCYEIDPSRPGVVLIINQELFYNEVHREFKHLLPPSGKILLNRQGTNKDRDKLEEVFKQFGYKVIVKNDLNHLVMLQEIKTIVDSICNESSLFICIMSHGDEGVIYGCNSCHVKVSKIQEIMFTRNQRNLAGKPKILILQSCQGNECQKLLESKNVEDIHTTLTTDGPSANIRDTLTFWASFRGYAAIRNRKLGSWFIQTFCRMLQDYGNKQDFLKICTRINGSIQNMEWNNEEDEILIMTPVLESTLGKDFYLPPLNGYNKVRI